jgi:hypothetical protein
VTKPPSPDRRAFRSTSRLLEEGIEPVYSCGDLYVRILGAHVIIEAEIVGILRAALTNLCYLPLLRCNGWMAETLRVGNANFGAVFGKAVAIRIRFCQ